MAFDNPDRLKDEGKWLFEESSEVAIDFNAKLKWMKKGFLWALSLSDTQRRIAYKRIFLKLKFSEIADEMGVSPITARVTWKHACEKGLEIGSEE